MLTVTCWVYSFRHKVMQLNFGALTEPLLAGAPYMAIRLLRHKGVFFLNHALGDNRSNQVNVQICNPQLYNSTVSVSSRFHQWKEEKALKTGLNVVFCCWLAS